MWVAVAVLAALRGAPPTVLLALPAAGRGLVAGLVVRYEPVARLGVCYASVAELVQRFRPLSCIRHRFVRVYPVYAIVVLTFTFPAKRLKLAS